MNELDHMEGVESAGSLKRRSVRGGAATIIGQGARFVLKLAAQVLIARLLLPKDYGLIAMVAPLLALVQLIGDLGLGQAIIQQAEIKRSDINALFWFGNLVNGALAVFVACSAPLIAWIYHEPRLIGVTVALAALLFFTGLGAIPSALLTRNMRFGVLATADVFGPAVGFAVGLFTAWQGWSYWALVVSMAAENATVALFVWTLGRWRPSAPALPGTVWSLVRTGGHITGFNLANYFTGTADNMLLGLTRGAVALGLYDKGYKIVTQPITQLIAPANRIAVPLLINLANDDVRYRRAYLAIVQLIYLILLPGLIFVMLTARTLIAVAMGAQWVAMAPIISWLCIGGMASPLYASAYWLFVSQQRAQQQLRYGVATSIISVAGFAIGLIWGPTGVAAGAGLSFILLATPLTMFGATRSGPVTAGNLVRALTPFIVATPVAIGAVWGLTLLPVLGLYALLSLALALATAYASFGLVLVLQPAGRGILAEAWSLRSMIGSRG